LCYATNRQVGPAPFKYFPDVYASGSDVWALGLRIQVKSKYTGLRGLHDFHGKRNHTQRSAALLVHEKKRGLCAGSSKENGRPFHRGCGRSDRLRRGLLLRDSPVGLE